MPLWALIWRKAGYFPLMSTSALTLVSRQLIAIAQIAEYLVQEQTGMNKSCEWDKLGDACLNIVNLTREELADVLDEYRTADFSNN